MLGTITDICRRSIYPKLLIGIAPSSIASSIIHIATMSRRAPPQVDALCVIMATLVLHVLLRPELHAVAAQPLHPPLDSTGWIISANSEESRREDGSVSNLLDGDEGTMWHTQWSGPSDDVPDYTHSVTINFAGKLNAVTGLRYLPRQDKHDNGNIGTFEVRHRVDRGKEVPLTRAGPLASDSSFSYFLWLVSIYKDACCFMRYILIH